MRELPDDATPRAAGLPALALLCLLGAAACRGGPTLQGPRPLSALVESTSRILSLTLSPQCIARDVGDMAGSLGRLTADELDLGTARSTLPRVLAGEPARVRTAANDAVALVSDEGQRLGQLRRSPGLRALDPLPDTADLANDLRNLPHLLVLDRRPLGEPDDVEHRTDPDDDHPEASWLNRLLRRLFP